MTWDSSQPVGSNDIALGDDAIRENNTAIEAALTIEHDFSTGGTQSGRHKFARDTAANIAVMANAVDGSIGFANDVRTGKLVLMVRESASWEYVDIYQPTTLPRLDEQSQFTACQFAPFEVVTPASGTPDTVAIDLATSPLKRTTVVGDTLISNPTNAVSGHGTTFSLEIIQDDTGGHTITWGSEYIAVGGAAPPIASGENEKTLLTITQTANNEYIVRSEPNATGPL